MESVGLAFLYCDHRHITSFFRVSERNFGGFEKRFDLLAERWSLFLGTE
jgi:hypothetical protein